MKTYAKTLLRRGALSLLLLGAPLTARVAETRAVAPATTEQAATGSTLAGTEWELTAPTYAGLEKRPFLKFSETRLSASVGCNSMGGAYTIEGEQITIKGLMSTRMACSEPLMNAENQYSKGLQSARSFTVSADGQSLTLRGDQTFSFRLTGRTSQDSGPTAKPRANTPEKAEKVVTQADNGSTVTLNANGILVVRLEDNPSTGYSRALVSFPDMPIRLLSHQMLAHAPAGVNGTPLVGAPSTHEWRFVVEGQAAFERTVWLKFLRLRPFDKGIDTAGLWEIKVTVPQSPAQ